MRVRIPSQVLISAGVARRLDLMSQIKPVKSHGDDVFVAAEAYDLSINWPARLSREIPVLTDLFGPPHEGGILDAGCGTGRQATALVQKGYRVVGADLSDEMLDVARQVNGEDGHKVKFIKAAYSDLPNAVGGEFDGVYCLANALAAAGSKEAVKDALGTFAQCLRSGGRCFIQVLNFQLMRREVPCVRGPRVATVNGRDYVSVRHFHFINETVQVTNVTIWHEDTWRQRAHCGTLYPVCPVEIRDWCKSAGLRIDDLWGGYDRSPFDPEQSVDLIVVATRVDT